MFALHVSHGFSPTVSLMLDTRLSSVRRHINESIEFLKVVNKIFSLSLLMS